MKLPEGIDPTTPIGELTEDQIISIAASIRVSRRWAKTGPRKRKEFGKKVVATRQANLTPEEISANCRKGGLARARNAGQKLRKK